MVTKGVSMERRRQWQRENMKSWNKRGKGDRK